MAGAGCTGLTQGFFEHLLEHHTLDRVAREKGRFRSFLLASLKYYVADQRAHEQRQKRGGGQRPFSLDASTAEERYRLEPKDNRTPEQLFERRWVLARLREEYAGSGWSVPSRRVFRAHPRPHGQ